MCRTFLVHAGVSSIHTPTDIVRFTRLLTDHPDKAFSSCVSRDLQAGFRIGFTGRRQTVMDANLPLCTEHPVYISEYLATSCSQGKTCCPYFIRPFPYFQYLGIGMVPKKNSKLRISTIYQHPLAKVLTMALIRPRLACLIFGLTTQCKQSWPTGRVHC